MGGKMKNFILIVSTSAVVLGFIYAGFLAKRTVHYKMYYETQVKNELKPLQKRIEVLESNVFLLNYACSNLTKRIK